MKTWIATLALMFFGANAWAGATVTGTVKFEGEAPAMKTLAMDADPVCVTNNAGKEVKSETLVLGAGNTMGNIFVRVKSGLPAGKTYTAPADAVVVDQKGCKYVPHVIGAMVGQPVKILNSDGTLHNVHGLPTAKTEFNEAMPKFKKEVTRSFDKEEVVFPVKCDVHPWMQGYVGVVSHPFFAVTKEDGKFSIGGLEPGTYEIEVWHEKLGTQVVSVTVAEGDSKTADFTFKKSE
jgi:plastocyanin